MIARLRRRLGPRLSPSAFDLWTIAAWFVGLRLVTLAVMEVAATRAPAWGKVVYELQPPHALEPFLRFDPTFYIGIARYGYPAASTSPVLPAAFFPLYPLLVRGMAALVGDFYVSALLVANVAALGAAFAIYGLARTGGTRRQARTAALWLLASPAGHFLSLPYGESVFCLLVALGLWAVARDRPLWACLAGALASATRATGLVVGLALLVRGVSRRRPAWLVAALGSGAGFGAFAAFCLVRYGDPFYFAGLQAHWGRHTTLLGPFTALGAFAFDPDYYLVTLAAIVLAAILVKRRVRPEITWSAWASILIPLWTGTLKSMIRFQGTNVPLLAGGATALPARTLRWVLAAGFALQLWEAGRFAAGLAAN